MSDEERYYWIEVRLREQEPFITIGKLSQEHGLNVWEIIASDDILYDSEVRVLSPRIVR